MKKAKRSAWGAKAEPGAAEVLNLQTGASKGLPAPAAEAEARDVALQQAEHLKRRKLDSPAPVARVDRERPRGEPKGPYTSAPNRSTMLERHERGLVVRLPPVPVPSPISASLSNKPFAPCPDPAARACPRRIARGASP
jgi:hypothetical protein